ncbi:MAG TPA: PaaI family thioesterase [Kofleriaceae bacterium]|nr:PaaI family thioesterase [Kofleriaceae bacterium]
MAATFETRTYQYDARVPDPAHMLSMSGLEYLRGILRGEFPAAPIAATLGFTLTELDHGRAVFEGSPERFTYNPLGTVHGGWAATILDSAMGCAVHTTLPAGKGYTTVDLSVSLVRAITDRVARLRCEATVVHTGGSIATAEGRITDEKGTLYAHGRTTCLLLTPR